MSGPKTERGRLAVLIAVAVAAYFIAAFCLRSVAEAAVALLIAATASGAVCWGVHWAVTGRWLR